MAGRLEGKFAVITGGGAGMGKAMGELFTREGARVILADVSGNQNDVAAAIGDAAIPTHCDVTKEEEIQNLIALAEKEFGRLDILCNNVGLGGHMNPIHKQTSDYWDFIHTLTLKSVFLGMKYGITSMLKTGGGSIINISSAAGVVGWKHHGIYGAAKAGVSQLTKTGALDYARENIRINAIVPGTIWTTSVDASFEHPEPPEDFPKLAGIPMHRWGLAREIANAALFLASDESSYTTGALLPVDGGYCIGFSGMGGEHQGITSSANEGDIAED